MPDALDIVAREAVAHGVERLRVVAGDGASTTAHVARYPRSARARVVRLEPPQPVGDWAEAHGERDVISGGFFAKPEHVPLGELRVAGAELAHRPFEAPWNTSRGSLCVRADDVLIDARDRVDPRDGDTLLQAGPVLVAGGRAVVARHDPEGFASTAHEFDQDLTADRLPRMALGRGPDGWIAVAVDGRGGGDDGLFLGELADLLVRLGAVSALNLDGGSSSALVAAGSLWNTPRDDEGEELPAAGPTPTAIVFRPGVHAT